jgi:hypothetical protein
MHFKTHMKYTVFLILVSFCISCQTPQFDPDRRQIMAKDAIHSKLGSVRGYDIVSYHEDTLNSWTDTLVKRPIQYTMEVTYQDSTGAQHFKNGQVIFTPDGKSIIETIISDQAR